MQAKNLFQTVTLLAAVTAVAFGMECLWAPKGSPKFNHWWRAAPLTSLTQVRELIEDFRPRGPGILPANLGKYLPAKKGPALTKTFATLHLKNGSAAEGELLSEEEGWIKILMEGSEVGFHASEIQRVEKRTETVPS